MRKLALIPARGGSKRLPRKNVLEFQERPMIAHTITAATETGLFDRVCVSTDDREIADVARCAGAEVFIRPEHLASDTAQVREVCHQFLDQEESAGRVYDLLCCLYATAPLRTAEDIIAVVNLIEPGKCDFSMAVCEYDHPAYQALKVGEDGELLPMWPDIVNIRSQEIGQLLAGNGSTYAVSVEAFRRENTFYGDGLRGHIMPRERSVDIDLPFDLKLAKFFAEQMTS